MRIELAGYKFLWQVDTKLKSRQKWCYPCDLLKFSFEIMYAKNKCTPWLTRMRSKLDVDVLEKKKNNRGQSVSRAMREKNTQEDLKSSKSHW